MMKKFSAFFLILISLSAFSFTGCSPDTFTQQSYSVDGTGIENVTVEVTDRALEISASEDQRIYIDYFDGEKQYLDITVIENKELTIRLIQNKEWTDFIGTKPPAEYRKIKLKLPDGCIAALSASTTNENIRLTSLSFTEQVNLNTNGGSILCECADVGKAIRFTAKNGDITGSVIGGWDDFSISCTVKKGNCNLPTFKESGEKLLFADCNHGDIHIEFRKP